jgi:parvulin-like peptidyl-prolyl cis-trans isomerase-like protein
VRRILSEPLAHFLAIGALMFAVYALVADRSRDPAAIVVGQSQIDAMSALFERTWRRTPTPGEVKALIDGYVREEVLYREGMAMGLDRGDQLIRRRVGQKVEFLAESMHGVPEPSDAALQAYLDGRRERFASPMRATFRQVYLGTAAGADTARLLAQLNRLGDSDAAADMGRATQLDARMVLAPPADIERAFGRRFAQSLAAVPAGAWTGPIASDYGLHLVRVGERVDGRTPVLGEVRDIVQREWQREALAAANEKYYEGVRAKYAVRIENSRVALAK